MKRIFISLVLASLLVLSMFSFQAHAAFSAKKTTESYTIKDWNNLPFENDKTYLIGGYFIEGREKTYFAVELNKGKEELTILCTKTVDKKDDTAYCLDLVIRENSITYQDKQMLIIITELSSGNIGDGEPIQITGMKKISSTSYFHDSGTVAADNDQGEMKYYHTDYLGSTRVVTGPDAKQQLHIWAYYPFGRTVVEAGIYDTRDSTTAKFTGHKDDSELYYMGARYYDTDTGRFLSVDPIVRPDNVFTYADNNPLKFVDPTGMSTDLPDNVYADDFVGPLPEGSMYESDYTWGRIRDFYGSIPEPPQEQYTETGEKLMAAGGAVLVAGQLGPQVASPFEEIGALICIGIAGCFMMQNTVPYDETLDGYTSTHMATEAAKAIPRAIPIPDVIDDTDDSVAYMEFHIQAFGQGSHAQDLVNSISIGPQTLPITLSQAHTALSALHAASSAQFGSNRDYQRVMIGLSNYLTRAQAGGGISQNGNVRWSTNGNTFNKEGTTYRLDLVNRNCNSGFNCATP